MHGRIFKEEQTYRGTWVLYAVIMLELPTLVLVSVLTLTSKSDKQEAILVLLLVASIMVLALALLANIKLETRIDEKGIHFRYFPFAKWRLIERSNVKTARLTTFSPLTDHGGWGIKGNKEMKTYTLLGDRGVLIDFGEKKKILIGTQKAKELGEFIENWMEE